MAVAATPARLELAATVAALARTWPDIPAGDRAAVTRVFGTFREQIHAGGAVMWEIVGRHGRCALSASPGEDGREPTIDRAGVAMAIERLHRNDVIVCGPGEVSGVESLVPDCLDAFVAIPVRRHGEIVAVLIVGWAVVAPIIDADAVNLLRIVAALFATAWSSAPLAGTRTRATGQDSVLDSLSDAVAAIDRHGVVVGISRAWTGGAAAITPKGVGPEVHVSELLGAAGLAHREDVLAGVADVCTGMAERFDTTIAGDPADAAGGWLTFTATRWRRPGGGAIVAYHRITAAQITMLAHSLGDDRFRALVDTVPVPIWIVSARGELRFANAAWAEITGSRGIGDAGGWIRAVHPDDRPAAMSALAAAVARGERMEVEVRMMASDGSYRWWSVIGAPRTGSDGTAVDEIVGVAGDITAVRQARESLQILSRKLIAAQEGERSRIARELHDDLGQQIALLASRLDAAVHDRRRPRVQLQRRVADAAALVHEIASSVHDLAHQLHPAKLRLLGLVPTLEALCRDVADESGRDVRFDAAGFGTSIPDDVALGVFRVTQEALQNAVKHSDAKTMTVTLRGNAQVVVLRVEDDGRGFVPTTAGAGLGLQTMRERVELVGGRLTIAAARGRGTVIEAIIALRAEHDGGA